jgi:hypothetical protein
VCDRVKLLAHINRPGAVAPAIGRVLPPRHDGQQNIKNPPPVLPDESSTRRKNILLSETQKL